MNPQQTPPNPNTAPVAQPTLEQIAAQQASAPNLQPNATPVAATENLASQVEAAPMPMSTTNPATQPVGDDTQGANTPPPAQAVHTGSVQGRALQAQDLAQLSASDDDLIEKEWVDTVEDVIEKDEDDPAMEDIDHNTVSRAYQKQRFNLDVS